MKRSVRRMPLLLMFAVLCAALWCLALFFGGVLHPNRPDPALYPVAGVDVSSYQGTIDWETLASQNIRFAFIKATEGSSYVDPRYEENRAAAEKTDLRVGAYHFFSFDSPGATQADLFCRTVPKTETMLPPVVDVEYYGAYRFRRGSVDHARLKNELRTLVDLLEAAYGIKPVLYADAKTYKTILLSDFADCDLWYRSVYTSVPGGIDWTFWQYSDKHVLAGYDGKERFIDMNVFAGSAEDFAAYPDRSCEADP